MARVVYAAKALSNLERAFATLAELADAEVATTAVARIRSAVEMLEYHPLIGRIVTADLRELVISFGKTGYIALYRHVAKRDEVRVLAIRHQRELDYP